MDRSDHEAHSHAIATLARSMHSRLSRRRAAGLVAATVATGLLGIAPHSQPVQARKKRGKRHAARNGETAEARRGIPPNCIYVCCDGTCDSWKMCLRCVTWPKPTTTSSTLAN